MKDIKHLLKFIKPYKISLIVTILCMATVTGMNLVAPWMIRTLIQTVSDNIANYQKISTLSILVIVIYIFRAIAQFGTSYVSHYTAWQYLKDLRIHLYNHIQKLSLKYFDDKQTGELMSRIINDTRTFEQMTAHAIPTIIVNVLMVLGVSIILFYMNIPLALLTLIPIPFIVIIVLKFSLISRPKFKVAQEKIAELNSILQENISGIKEIKAFTQEEYESKRVGEKITNVSIYLLKALKVSAVFHPTIQFLSGIGTVIVIFFGGRLALAGKLPLEDLVAFILYLGNFYQPITALGQINEGLQQALASADRVLEVLNTQPDIIDPPNARDIKIEGSIEFQDVSFMYIDSIPVLKNVSFKAEAGKTIALVGPTGVGKTTIARLIPRFYEAGSGKILIDGIDIKDIKLSCLRKHISIVSQDVFLFNGTVLENILYGKPDATFDEVVAAAKTANAHDFIMKLKDGYNTHIGERGVKLSGGQKQRISIARAVLKNAPILILDEATSSVDTQTERLIQDALNKLMKNKTSIVIAHRLSTVENANRIIVLEEGSIIESGSHEELLKAKGLYSSLCAAQIPVSLQL
ncbi:MAG TPA: ABC transporter ATP-binding protein [Clostridiaceae bacterium]|nr:ABC transporter ATP-binding protein [Clostridiaceae bacterium]